MMRVRTALSAQFSLAAVLLLLTVSSVAGSKWVPKLEDRITDTANVLSAPDRKRLTEMLARYERETFHQIAVLTIPSLLGESIESFSGPIAISLAASKPAGLRGLVLVCSFARSPILMPSGLCSVISRCPVKLIPTRTTAALLLGRYASRALRERLSAAISKVHPAAWRARLNAVLSANVAVCVSSIRVPVLYPRTQDRVVPRRASELIGKLLPSTKVVELEAPHFMLQAKPVESALHIQAFARELGIVF